MRKRMIAAVFVVLTVASASVPLRPQENSANHQRAVAELPAVLMHDIGDISSMDLFYGAGGKDHAPDMNSLYTFTEEDMGGTAPKFDVLDSHGTRWKVKLGDEARPETAATRLLWAAGYFVDEDYYAPELKVDGIPELRRGKEFVSEDDIVRGARLERKDPSVKTGGNWEWSDNRFVGTREYNGLRIMMVLLNNWDVATKNNSQQEAEGEIRYVVTDMGATLGNTGTAFSRSKGKVEDYAASQFIDEVEGDMVNFVIHTRLPFPAAVVVPLYIDRAQRERIGKQIPRADAKWLGDRLGRLTETQIRDCFRAAGYNPAEVEGYTKAVQDRIDQLKAL